MYFKRMRDLRKDNNKTQSEIAEILMCETNKYARYEKGISEIPLSIFIKLAKYYNVSVDYIIELTDDPIPHKRK